MTGHGFSPTFTVTLPDGTEFTDVSVPFLPSDQATMASEGALKLPDLGAGSDDQLALEGFFAPTGVVQGGVLTSVDPRPLDPQVAVVVYQGYLGLDSGIPQSVYSLDAAQIDRGRLDRGGRGEPGGRGVDRRCPTARRSPSPATGSSPRCSTRTTPARCGCSARRSRCSPACSGMLLLRRERVFARVAARRRRRRYRADARLADAGQRRERATVRRPDRRPGRRPRSTDPHRDSRPEDSPRDS